MPHVAREFSKFLLTALNELNAFKMSFLRYKELIEEGDTVIVYLGITNIYAIQVQRGKVFQTKYGALRHDDVIGSRYGSVVHCSKGWLHVLFPTPELWTLTLPHRTQILYTPDISLIVTQLELRPGHVVCEAGTGSGSLSHAIARIIAPSGHLHTFDFHEQRVKLAQEEFASHGLGDDMVTAKHRDVCKQGFGLRGVADAVFLDLPHPWEVIPFAREAMKKTARFCSFSPCIEQVQRTCLALEEHGFQDITTLESVHRPYEVKEVSMPVFDPKKASSPVAADEDEEDVPACGDAASEDAATTSKRQHDALRNGDTSGTTKEFYAASPLLQIAGHTGFLTFATLYPFCSEEEEQDLSCSAVEDSGRTEETA